MPTKNNKGSKTTSGKTQPKNKILLVKKTKAGKTSTLNRVASTSNFISLETAGLMITSALDIDNRPPMDYPKEIIQDLLNMDGVVGIRIYNAIDENSNRTYVIKGYDENNYDVHLSVEGTLGAIDMGQPCNPGTNVYQMLNR